MLDPKSSGKFSWSYYMLDLFVPRPQDSRVGRLNFLMNGGLLGGFFIINLLSLCSVASVFRIGIYDHVLFLTVSAVSISYFTLRLNSRFYQAPRFLILIIITFLALNSIVFLWPATNTIPIMAWSNNVIYTGPWFEETHRFVNLILIFDLLSARIKSSKWQYLANLIPAKKIFLSFLVSSSIFTLSHYMRFGEGVGFVIGVIFCSVILTTYTLLTGNYLFAFLYHSAHNCYTFFLPDSLPKLIGHDIRFLLLDISMVGLFAILSISIFLLGMRKIRFPHKWAWLRGFYRKLPVRNLRIRVVKLHAFLILALISFYSLGGAIYLLSTPRTIVPNSVEYLTQITPPFEFYGLVPKERLEDLRYEGIGWLVLYSTPENLLTHVIKAHLTFQNLSFNQKYWIHVEGIITPPDAYPTPITLSFSINESQSNYSLVVLITEADLGTPFQYDIMTPMPTDSLNFTIIFRATCSAVLPPGDFILKLDQFVLIY